MAPIGTVCVPGSSIWIFFMILLLVAIHHFCTSLVAFQILLESISYHWILGVFQGKIVLLYDSLLCHKMTKLESVLATFKTLATLAFEHLLTYMVPILKC